LLVLKANDNKPSVGCKATIYLVPEGQGLEGDEKGKRFREELALLQNDLRE
jgi:hypothetical protein